MKKLLLLLILSFLSAQGLAGECPDGSEPVKSISADGSYYEFKCSNKNNNILTNSNGNTLVACELPKNAHFDDRYESYEEAVENCHWLCDVGYMNIKNSSCNKMTPKLIPQNAYKEGSGWKCKDGYIFDDESYFCAAIPDNSHMDDENKYGWKCNSGYYRYLDLDMYQGGMCIKLPSNAYRFEYPESGWGCNPGYVRVKDEWLEAGGVCKIPIKIPPNAHAYGSGWQCNQKYIKSGNSCIRKGALPSNSHKSGGGWECNNGYVQYGSSCVKKAEDETKKSTTKSKILDDKVYSAASGSGFAVTSDGYVITNYHVIKGCTDVYIHDKGKSIISTIVTFDPNNDIALLKGDFKPKSFYPLSRESTKLLTEVYVAGHPFGRDISTAVKVTRGIVSSLTGVANNFSNLQIDASLQPGNSGGPIMNDKGNVIGVAVAKLNLDKIIEDYGVVPENVNFGVKANLVINIMESENIKLPKPNLSSLPMSNLSEMITDGTYYLSCWMTMAQIETMLEQKVMFSNLK